MTDGARLWGATREERGGKPCTVGWDKEPARFAQLRARLKENLEKPGWRFSSASFRRNQGPLKANQTPAAYSILLHA